MRHILILFSLLMWSATAVPATDRPADPQVSRGDLIEVLGRLFTGPEMRADLHALGFRDEKLELAMGHIRSVMADPLIAGYIADRVLEARGGAYQMAGANGLVWHLIDRGTGHLPLRDLEYYYKVQRTVLYGMPTRECGLLIKGRLSPTQMAEITSRTAARLNAPALKTYYRIQLQAARLGVSREPRRLTPAEAERLGRQLELALSERVRTDPEARDLQRVFSAVERASTARACAAGRLFLDTVLGLTGRDLQLGLIYLSTP